MEIEIKFALADANGLRRLQTATQLASFTLGAEQRVEVRDIYLDTADHTIEAAGYVCRRRKTNAGILITLKALTQPQGEVHRREELEIALPRMMPPYKWTVSPARDHLLAIIGTAKLVPICRLRQTRITRAILDDTRQIAELSLDRVRVGVPPHTLTFREAEVELGPQGTEVDLEKIAACLRDEWQLPIELRSKFERARAFTATPVEPGRSPRVTHRPLTEPGLRADDAMSEAARKILRFHWQRVVANETETRAGNNIEALHDMRVATRRLRAALRVFDDFIDHETLAPFAKALRRTGRTLGAVRDLDVFREKTQLYLDTLPAERQTELEMLLAVWETKHAAARQTLIAYLDSAAYTRLTIEFDALVQSRRKWITPPLADNGEPHPYRVRHNVPQILERGVAAVRAYDEWLAAPAVPLTRLHQLRIASKGLRYTLEFFTEVLGADAKPLIEKIKQLQDHLGNIQDAVVTCNLLREFLARGTWGEPNGETASDAIITAPGVAAYLAARQTELQSLVETFPAVWAEINQPNFWRQVALLAAAC